MYIWIPRASAISKKNQKHLRKLLENGLFLLIAVYIRFLIYLLNIKHIQAGILSPLPVSAPIMMSVYNIVLNYNDFLAIHLEIYSTQPLHCIQFYVLYKCLMNAQGRLGLPNCRTSMCLAHPSSRIKNLSNSLILLINS